MRELDRHPQPPSAPTPVAPDRVALICDGRLGNALADGLRTAGLTVLGPLGRGAAPSDADVVLLCVPDDEIAVAAALVPAAVPLGHCSGATSLEVLAGHDAFSLHPLMTVATETTGAAFAGAGAAVAGTSPEMLALARDLAVRLGMRPIEIASEDRPAYHAAASIASNFLVTLEAAAERLATTVGMERADLVPLVRAAVENWAALGPERALTGPVARGDESTVARQRQAIAERAPELLALFDTLVQATRALAASGAVV
ncbi:MAG TPA: DUF2520 domain-containing protein [Solirubrobacteraceae bacterium]|nr:DUF2520 domain-containing protein [Solirubrobacteraceae bacterium]